jgi:hypothetical protein
MSRDSTVAGRPQAGQLNVSLASSPDGRGAVVEVMCVRGWAERLWARGSAVATMVVIAVFLS